MLAISNDANIVFISFISIESELKQPPFCADHKSARPSHISNAHMIQRILPVLRNARKLLSEKTLL
mgnify:FL=1